MRKIFRARHADPRGAVPRVSDRRRRRSPQARPAPRRNDRELIPSLPCRSSLRVCRSRSATVEDLAASNSSASARAFIFCQERQARRLPSHAADQVRAGDQPSRPPKPLFLDLPPTLLARAR